MLIDVVATIMKRTKINDYCALYSVSKTTTGHYDDEMNVFYRMLQNVRYRSR